MRRVCLFIAMSLDGCIADRAGGVDWLQGCGPEGEPVDAYEEFIAQVDTILMGWNTYHQIVTELSPQAWVYEGRMTYVLTHRSMADTEQIRFTDQAPAELVRRLRMQPGQDIWICGGAALVQQLMQEDLIDRYIITLVPLVLGGGIRLFGEMEQAIPLRLIRSRICQGMTELTCERRLSKEPGER